MNSQLVLPARSFPATAPAEKCMPTSVEPSDFRHAMSMLATGIVVVSCTLDSGETHGMTVNSFTSISLDPPTVLVSLKPGMTSGLVARRGRFAVSILREDQQDLSALFSGRPSTRCAPAFVVRSAQPTLEECLAWFECELLQTIDVYDHSLYVAHVTACGDFAGSPLLYFGSRYRATDPLT